MQDKINTSQGFSLIELLLVSSIIIILMYLCIPTYRHYLQRMRRIVVIQELTYYQLLFERCYTTTVDFKQCKASLFANNKHFPAQSKTQYLITAEVTQNAYQLIASASLFGLQSGDKEQNIGCETLSINQMGEKTPKACW